MPESILQRPPPRTEQLWPLQPANDYDAQGVVRLPDVHFRSRQVRRFLENVFGHRPVGIQPGRNRAVSDAGCQRHQSSPDSFRRMPSR